MPAGYHRNLAELRRRVPIMSASSLPDRYLITPDPSAESDAVAASAGYDAFLARLDAALAGGITLVQLRAKTLPVDAWTALSRDALRICHARGAMLIANGPPAAFDLTRPCGADGLHLNSRRLMSLTPAELELLKATRKRVSAACHDAQQLERAAELGIDFVTLSPVLPTQTHPDAEPLGWPRFTELVQQARVPVYALGGMRPEHLPLARTAGAQGIAAIRGLW
jgi:thiamine-phosphate diphosphorylase